LNKNKYALLSPTVEKTPNRTFQVWSELATPPGFMGEQQFPFLFSAAIRLSRKARR
jgi:hypothetical protein